MHRQFVLIQSMVWASAIIAAACVGASAFFTLVLLPAVGGMALLLQMPRGSCAAVR